MCKILLFITYCFRRRRRRRRTRARVRILSFQRSSGFHRNYKIY